MGRPMAWCTLCGHRLRTDRWGYWVHAGIFGRRREHDHLAVGPRSPFRLYDQDAAA